MIGDRLDTDIAGANAANLPRLLLLSGVSTTRDLLCAAAGQRPAYLGHDLRALHGSPDRLKIGPQAAWHVDVGASGVTIRSAGTDPGDDGLAVVRAAGAAWDARFDVPFAVFAGDNAARAALECWSLL